MLFGAFRPQTIRGIKAPGEAEESATRQTFEAMFFEELSWTSSQSKVMKKRFRPPSTLDGTVALSFVIPSAAEGSAVLRTLRGNVFRQSGAVCGFAQSVTNAAVHKTTAKRNSRETRYVETHLIV
jgi:hypothetical protein